MARAHTIVAVAAFLCGAGVTLLYSAWTSPPPAAASEPSPAAAAPAHAAPSETAAPARDATSARPPRPGTVAATAPLPAPPPLPASLVPPPLPPLLAGFETADNLPALIQTLTPLAQAGDAGARRVLARALAECYTTTRVPKILAAKEPTPAEAAWPAQREAYLRQLSRHRQRCRQLVADRAVTPQRLQQAESAAFSTDDDIGRAYRLTNAPASLPAAEIRETLRRIARSHDAEAIFVMADLLAQQDDTDVFGPQAGELSSWAWKLVACDLGYPCGPDSALVRRLCIDSGYCVPGGYREVIRHFYLSPWSFQLAVENEAHILQALAAGDIDALFP